MAISTPRSTRSAISTDSAGRDRSARLSRCLGCSTAAMGATTVIPDMDPSRPGPGRSGEDRRGDSRLAGDAGVRFAGDLEPGRPVLRARGIRLPTVRRVLSAGAPVPAHVLAADEGLHPSRGRVHTPYGARRPCPWRRSRRAKCSARRRFGPAAGAGVCVGRHFPGIRWKVVRIVDGPIRSPGRGRGTARRRFGPEIGELIVQGPVVTREYVTRCETNALGKIVDGEGVASDGGRRLSRRPGAFLVLRPVGPPRADGRRADVSGPVRGDFQSASGRLPHRAGGGWARGPAAAGHDRRAEDGSPSRDGGPPNGFWPSLANSAGIIH